MPRGKRRRTQGGAPAQSVESVPGQRYGEGVEQQALQRAAPAADRRAEAPTPAMAPPTTAGAPPPADPAALAGMLGQAPIGLFSGSQLPDEPVTTGLSSGPGLGVEALGNLRGQSPLSRMLATLSQRTGDPAWDQLRERARL